MKYTLHIPTEQFGFCEVEYQPSDVFVAPEKAAELYKEVSKAFAPKPENEMPKKDFDAYLDNQLLENHKNGEELFTMSPAQQSIVQAVKRSMKRIAAREDRPTINE